MASTSIWSVSEGITGIIGTSEKIEEVRRCVRRIAERKIDVLLLGESGTGKEVVARAIHELSAGAGGPFVSVNCAGVPSALIESELFGHEKGSFTGAVRRHLGKFELAHHGTLFLDEIGDMSLEMQAKLLRIVELGEFTRVGGEASRHWNARIICATNKELGVEVREGRFREDLFYRINVDCVVLPPLRERIEDVPTLVDYFIKTLGPELATPVTCVTSEALGVLAKHHWPGNIRELRNATRRAMAYCDGNAILAEDLPAYLRSGEPRDAEWSWPERLEALLLEADAGELPNDLLGRIEDRLIPAILRKTGGNKLKTAQILGLAINTLRKRIKDHQPVAVTFVTAGRGAAGIV